MPYKDPEKRKAYQKAYKQRPYAQRQAARLARERYPTVRGDILRKTSERKAETRQWVHEQKALLGCSTCGEKDPVCLQYHHRDPAEKSFTIGTNLGRSRRALLREMAKCDVLCANCHWKLEWKLKRQSIMTS